MSPHSRNEPQAVFTAGFSNLSVERFLGNLRAYDIETLVDVRSRPYAKYTPHFNRDQIEQAARAAGLHYLYLGRELGGLPDNPGFYDREGYVLYDRIAVQPWFRQGIELVLGELGQGRRLALSCAEDNPRHCHRRLLVGRVLRERGVGVAHILANGGLIAEAELIDEERAQPRQLTLFGGAETPAWKSARPFAPRTPGGEMES
jgi:uncharacterized protein (DUF488 family)